MKLGINTFICPDIIWQIQKCVSSLINVQCKQVGSTLYVRSQNLEIGINTFVCPNIIWQIQTCVSSLINVQCKQVGMTLYVRSQNLDKSWIFYVSVKLFLLDFYVASCNVTCWVFIVYNAKKECHNGLQILKRSCVQSTNSTFTHELILIWSSYFYFDMIFCVKTCVNLLWFSSSWMFEVVE
jgi:uncharacterized Tic20 family protein